MMPFSDKETNPFLTIGLRIGFDPIGYGIDSSETVGFPSPIVPTAVCSTAITPAPYRTPGGSYKPVVEFEISVSGDFTDQDATNVANRYANLLGVPP